MGTTLSMSPPREKHPSQGSTANGFQQLPANDFRSCSSNSNPFMAANVKNLAERNARKTTGFLNSLNWKRFSVVTSSTTVSAGTINESHKKLNERKHNIDNKENLLVNGQKLSDCFVARQFSHQTSSDNNNQHHLDLSKNLQVFIPLTPNFEIRNLFSFKLIFQNGVYSSQSEEKVFNFVPRHSFFVKDEPQNQQIEPILDYYRSYRGHENQVSKTKEDVKVLSNGSYKSVYPDHRPIPAIHTQTILKDAKVQDVNQTHKLSLLTSVSAQNGSQVGSE